MKTLNYLKKILAPKLLLIIILSSCASQKFDHSSAYKFSHHDYNKKVIKEDSQTTLAKNNYEFDKNKSKNLYQNEPVFIGNEINNAASEPKTIQQNILSDNNELVNESYPVEEINTDKKVSSINKKRTYSDQNNKKVLKLNKRFKSEGDEPDPSKNWAAIASLPVGIVSLLVAGVLLGPTAIVFGALGFKSEKKGLAIAGFVIGIIGFIGALIFISAI